MIAALSPVAWRNFFLKMCHAGEPTGNVMVDRD
jgi:hypothetical protein